MNDSGLTRLFRLVVSHPVAMSMICLAALVFGMVSYQRLAIELMPDLSYPTLTVRTPFEGAAPEEVEAQVSRQIEARLATLNGLVGLESRSRANQSDVILSFAWGSDMSEVAQSARETLQTVFLPDNAERPMLLRYDPSLEPFLRVAVSVDADSVPNPEEALFRLRDVAEQELKRDLEAMAGVAAVQIRGGLEREIHVEIREDWMAARKISLADVQSTLVSENVNMAGGSIIEGNKSYLIRTLNEFESADSIRDLRIRRSDGVLIPMTDVAIVREGHRDRDVISYLDGSPAVELEIFKEADANVVAISNEVKQRLIGDGTSKEIREMAGMDTPLAETLPEHFSMALLDDQASFIESSVRNLRNTVLLGGILAVFVLFLFLRNARSTLIIGLAIPISVVLAFGPLYLWGISLNLMSLGGLALGVGMLVDNGVVVLESIQRYLDQEQVLENNADGVQSRSVGEAAVFGTRDVAAAVTASTLTTVAVFFPLTFVEGVAGELFGDLAIAVVASLVASLLVALFLVPTMAAIQMGDQGAGPNLLLSTLVDAWTQPSGTVWRTVAQRGFVAPFTSARTNFSDWWNRPKKGILWLALPYVVFRVIAQMLIQLAVGCVLLATAIGARLTAMVLGVVLWPVSIVFRGLAAAFQRVYAPLEARYVRLLPGALRRPGLVLGLAVLVTLVAFGFGRGLGSELIPELHQGRFTVEAALPVGTPIETTVEEVRRMESQIVGHPEIANVYTTVGADRRADTGSDEGEHSAKIRIQLKPGGDLAAREVALMEQMRAKLTATSGMALSFVRPALFSFKTPIEVVIYGYELDELQQTGDQVAERLAGLDGLRDVRSSQARGFPELRILYDRIRLHRYGLDTASVATKVRNRIQGVEATRLQRGDRKLDVRLQLSESQRQTVQDIRELNVNPNLVPPIPLDAVADVEEGYGPSEIRRVDQQRAVVISANTTGFDLGSASDEIRAVLMSMTFPEGVYSEMAGQAKEMQTSMSSLGFALLLAVFLVYVIMASSFESIVHPFVILFSVPLALVGVAMALWIFGMAISAVVAIGSIVLAGVVVNNAIVLVDTINRLRARGLPREQAISEAARLRLRPILMTTMTTILGLLPLAVGPMLLGWLPSSWGLAEGVEIQQPLAITVIGGLLSSTVLTLVIIPVLYRTMSRDTAQ